MTTAAAPAAPDTGALDASTINAENMAAREAAASFQDNPNPSADPAAPVVLPPPADADAAPTGERKLSLREQIAENAKAARRSAQGDPPLENGLATNEMGEYVPPAFRKAEEEPVDPPAPDAAKPDEGYTLKVRTKDVPVKDRAALLELAEVDEEDAELFSDAKLIKLAQKHLAAASYLEDAKEAAKSARTATRAPGDTQPDPVATDRETQPDPAAPHPEAKDPIKEAIERIQFGDPEEATEAFRDAVAKTAQAAIAEQDLGKRIASVENNVLTATQTFEAANADIVQDPDYAGPLYQRFLPQQFRADLVAAGLEPAKVDHVLGNTVESAMQAYVAVVADGRVKVRTPDQMLAAAAQELRTKFNRPAPAPTTQPQPAAPSMVDARLAAKRALPPQPTRASVPQETARTPAKKSGTSVVQEMRKARGQAV